jgi:signal transduction histidine kinase
VIVVDQGGLRKDESEATAMAAGRYLSLEVRDNGCGMDRETQDRIFDPFFTTKFLGRGLGMAAVHGFARSQGGAVRVESAPGKGTSIRLLLPAASEEETSRGVGR